MIYDRPIYIYRVDEETEKFVRYEKLPRPLHAAVNKARDKDEYLSGGSTQHQTRLTFDVRYAPPLQDIFDNPQMYRILFDGKFYDIVDVDDYQLQHRTLRMAGVSGNGR